MDTAPENADDLLSEVSMALRWAHFGGAEAVALPAYDAPVPAIAPAAKQQAPEQQERPAEPIKKPRESGPKLVAHAVGPRDARVVLVVAGKSTDGPGTCWQGEAGDLLAKMIGAMGLRTADVYAVTLVQLTPEQTSSVEPFSAQLRAVKPEVMLVFGQQAAHWMLRTDEPIDDLRGEWRTLARIKTMVTYGPDTLLAMPLYKRLAWSDLQQAMKTLGL